MPDRTLLDAYLERLVATMALPDAERRDAAEEIVAHVDQAVADMLGRGVPADIAERRALERLGPPERLADDLTSARRRSSHALAAIGTALRISIVTGVQYFLFAWAVVIVGAIASSLAVAGVRRLVGADVLQADWTPLSAGLFPGIVACAVAYGIGRTIVSPVAVAARRPAMQVRLPLAVAGACVTAWIALSAVVAPYHVAGALVMVSAPAWFLLGLSRHPSRPTPLLSSRVLVLAVAVFILGGFGLVLAAGGSSGVTSMESEAYDPNVEYAAVGPFVDVENPPLTFLETPGLIPTPGSGPVSIERAAIVSADFLDAWRDVRLEVWPGPPGTLNGPILDPEATAPLATGPMTFDGRRLIGTVAFLPRPDREDYFVATTGIGADGIRMQLAWPDLEWWRWEGTVIDFGRALIGAQP